MLILNNIIKTNILIFYNNILISNFLKSTIINKIKVIKIRKIKKKIFLNIKKKEKFIFNFLVKKIKHGFLINNKNFLPNNLIGFKKSNFPKKILNFEILLKYINLNNKILTRKINFKKKNKKKNIKINNSYIGIIKNIAYYGVFIDIGYYDGLLHISDIPNYKKIYNKLFTKNIILVKITKFNDKIKKISFNLKKNFKKNIKKKIFGIITCILKFKKFNLIYGKDKYLNKYKIYYSKLLKKNDLIKSCTFKNNNNYISLNHKLIVGNFKFVKLYLKYKITDYYLFSYKTVKTVQKTKINFTRLKDNFFYKKYIKNILNNEFYKIIYFKNMILIKFGNFVIKIYEEIKLSTLTNLKKKENIIYFFLKKY